jgi:hypothetical protein
MFFVGVWKKELDQDQLVKGADPDPSQKKCYGSLPKKFYGSGTLIVGL